MSWKCPECNRPVTLDFVEPKKGIKIHQHCFKCALCQEYLVRKDYFNIDGHFFCRECVDFQKPRSERPKTAMGDVHLHFKGTGVAERSFLTSQPDRASINRISSFCDECNQVLGRNFLVGEESTQFCDIRCKNKYETGTSEQPYSKSPLQTVEYIPRPDYAPGLTDGKRGWLQYDHVPKPSPSSTNKYSQNISSSVPSVHSDHSIKTPTHIQRRDPTVYSKPTIVESKDKSSFITPSSTHIQKREQTVYMKGDKPTLVVVLDNDNNKSIGVPISNIHTSKNRMTTAPNPLRMTTLDSNPTGTFGRVGEGSTKTHGEAAFCTECGASKPTITTKFCGDCGRPF